MSIWVHFLLIYQEFMLMFCWCRSHNGRRGRDRMAVGFTTEPIPFMARCTRYNLSGSCNRSVVFSRYNEIADILMKVALNTISHSVTCSFAGICTLFENMSFANLHYVMYNGTCWTESGNVSIFSRIIRFRWHQCINVTILVIIYNFNLRGTCSWKLWNR